MCGIAGIFQQQQKGNVDHHALNAMTQSMVNRGPDDVGLHLEPGLGLGFRRLSIIDLNDGNQPMYSEDRAVVAVCNGEIFNYKELRRELIDRGHIFASQCDTEVIVHLYEEEGAEFVKRLNGQFAFAIYDGRKQRLMLGRDQAGIAPLFYAVHNEHIIFASTIKAVLAYPGISRDIDLTALDQLISLPAVIAPRTMFRQVHALEAGQRLIAEQGNIQIDTYWDLNYPRQNEEPEDRGEAYYLEKLDALLKKSVAYRLQADVPVGCYLSGGLDSSLLAGLIHDHRPNHKLHTFSIGFQQQDIDERRYQQLMAQHIGARHSEVVFDWDHIQSRMRDMIIHAETPLKECYDTCSLALSELVHKSGFKVVLAGEGSDELFAGYAGYRFDAQRQDYMEDDLFQALEEEMNEALWGDPNLFYESKLYELRETKNALYASDIAAQMSEFECSRHGVVDKSMLRDRNPLHKRAYLDFKLRLGNHLLSDHGDRAGFANSVEVRYPFLDIELLEFITRLPAHYKFDGHSEKAILKKLARRYVPQAITDREKFGFVAPGTPFLLRQNIPWIEDMLSYERIKRQGYFNPDTVERLKTMYRAEDFMLHVPYETDLLMIVLTFAIFLESFEIQN